MLEPDPQEWKEALHVHGEVICDGCNRTIDLSGAETVNEAISIFNGHVRTTHRDSA